jgi:hypothetical protein
MPDTGSFRDKMTTSTLCVVASLKAKSFFTKENAWFGGLFKPLQLQLHVSTVVALLEDQVFFFKIKQGAR